MIKLTALKTFILSSLLCLTLYSDDPQAQFTKAEQTVKELGADSYKVRKKAIQTLISLGYYARVAVKKAFDSKDPEISGNAQKVWEKIRWDIVPKNSKEVSEFCQKIKQKTVNYEDWHQLVKLCGVDSLKVLLETKDEIIKFSAKPAGEDDEGLDLLDDGLLEEMTALNVATMFNCIFRQCKVPSLVKEINSYDQQNKDEIYEISHTNITFSSTYLQTTFLRVLNQVSSPKKTWELYEDIDFSSKMVRASLSGTLINYLKKNYQSFKTDSFYKALLILQEHKAIDLKMFNSMAISKNLSAAKVRTAKVFYGHSQKNLNKQTKLKLLGQGSSLWFLFQKNELTKKLSHKEFVLKHRDSIAQNKDLTDFIDHSFPMYAAKSMPYIEIEQDNQLASHKYKNWKLFSPQKILLTHYHRVGDYDKAQAALFVYNKEQQRANDSNKLFFSNQKKLMKAATINILKKVNQLEAHQHKEALTLLNDAEKLNPNILTVLIQKAEWEVKNSPPKKTTTTLQKALAITPHNLLEIRELVHICWDLNDLKLSEKFISKLDLDEDNYQNITLASQNHEFFHEMEKAQKFHKMLELEVFGSARSLFYSKKYAEMIPLCKKPEEGDFQFLWGVMAARVNQGSQAAKVFSKDYLYIDGWAELLGMTLTGELTPEELIIEATSPLSFGNRRGRLTEAYFYAAIYHMEKGKEDFKKVHQYLDKCLELNFKDYYEYVSAAVLKKILPGPPK